MSRREQAQQQVMAILDDLIKRYGLAVADAREDSHGTQVTLANATTALRIRREPREHRTFVTLHRLDKGPIAPLRDMSERQRDPLNGFDADDLISLRDSEHPIDQSQLSEQATLRAYADALLRMADDVLTGDFAVFSELVRIVVHRIEQQERDGRAVGPDARAFLRAAEKVGLA